jgi:hypothetical protein
MVVEHLRRVVLTGVVTVVAVGSARAQEPAGTIEQLRVLVKRGDTVSVTDRAGHELKGSIVELSSQSIRLRTSIHEQEVFESEIRTIRQRKDDSLADGARKGFAVGALLGLIGGAFVSEYAGFSAYPLLIGFYGGIGAGIGTGIDAMVTHNQTIYDSVWQPKPASIRFGVRLR